MKFRLQFWLGLTLCLGLISPHQTQAQTHATGSVPESQPGYFQQTSSESGHDATASRFAIASQPSVYTGRYGAVEQQHYAPEISADSRASYNLPPNYSYRFSASGNLTPETAPQYLYPEANQQYPYANPLPESSIEPFDPLREYIDKFLGFEREPRYLEGYYDPFSTQFAYGSMAVTPFQLGWVKRRELTYVSSAPVSQGGGDFQYTEVNGSSRYSARVDELHVFQAAINTNSRFLSGPSSVDLGPSLRQFQADFQLASNSPGPVNWQLGVTPQINSDFERQLTRDAYMVDGRAVLFNKLSPQLTLALGITYWDRNHGHILPYGGLIWAPDDRWEFRATFPQSRISYFAGNSFVGDIWLYGTAEYTLDAYQITPQDSTRIKQRLELQDYRFLIGVTALQPRFGAYLEGGYITDRHATFRGPAQDFRMGDAWLVRAGVTF